MSTKRAIINVRVSDGADEALREVEARLGITRSEAVRMILNDYLERPESEAHLYELLMQFDAVRRPVIQKLVAMMRDVVTDNIEDLFFDAQEQASLARVG